MFSYEIEYVHVQIYYARRWQEIGKLSFEEALRLKTCLLKVLFGISAKENRIPPEWNALSNELEKVETFKGAEIVLQLKKSGLLPPPSIKVKQYSQYFGPFRYIYEPENKEISLHYSIKNEENIVFQWHEGKELLAALFREVKEKLPEAKVVVVESTLMFGSFWKRMCPEEFFKRSKQADEDDYVLMAETSWSQFIDFKGRVKRERIEQFIGNLKLATNRKDLFKAFPIIPMRSTLDLDLVYRFYSV